jgi:Flp pilus assembly pilin Flp
VEYALLVALIAVVCIGAVTFLGTSSSDKMDKSGKALDGKKLVHCNVYMNSLLYLYYDDGTTETVQGTECPEIP